MGHGDDRDRRELAPAASTPATCCGSAPPTKTKRASWYEAMGIMVVWEAWNTEGGHRPVRPRARPGAATSPTATWPRTTTTAAPTSLAVNPKKLPQLPTHTVQITRLPRTPPATLERRRPQQRCTPTVTERAQSLTFVNDDASPLSPRAARPRIPRAAYMHSIFHTRDLVPEPLRARHRDLLPPGQRRRRLRLRPARLGTPASGQLELEHPDEPQARDAYTFFCRIHPFMRGVFRIVG